jgi:hypothetical protein
VAVAVAILVIIPLATRFFGYEHGTLPHRGCASVAHIKLEKFLRNGAVVARGHEIGPRLEPLTSEAQTMLPVFAHEMFLDADHPAMMLIANYHHYLHSKVSS